MCHNQYSCTCLCTYIPCSSDRERTLLVDGLPEDITEDILDLVFEDAAGTEDVIESVNVDTHGGRATLVFTTTKGKILRI